MNALKGILGKDLHLCASVIEWSGIMNAAEREQNAGDVTSQI
ncbi:MAG: hypothetical protein ORN23_00530 [Chthoniobacterales bacterium]|nr:hypothetical protein [Chthoniobacterales bacterium]